MKGERPIISAGSIRLVFLYCMLFAISFTIGSAYAAEKPNILVIMGDDVASPISALTAMV